MPNYVVKWQVDAVADSAIEAALHVAATYFQERIQQGHPDTACVFEVSRADTNTHNTIDLSTVQYELNAEQLRKMYGETDHPGYRKSEWIREVENEYTLLGYWEWVVHKLAEER